MASIELSTEDAALIVLALACERLGAAARLDLADLREHWGRLGLRVDDLIQAIAALARDGRATAHGDGPSTYLQLSPDCAETLHADHGIASLPQHLREFLAVAEARSAGAGEPATEERRNGFR